MFLKCSIEKFYKSIWKLYSKPVFRYQEEWYLIRNLPYKVTFDVPFKLGVTTFKHNLLFLHIPSDLEKNPPKQSLFCKYKRVTWEQKGHRFLKKIRAKDITKLLLNFVLNSIVKVFCFNDRYFLFF